MQNLSGKIIRRVVGKFLSEGFTDARFTNSFYLNARHAKPSIVGSLDDDLASQSSQSLMRLIAKSAERAAGLQIYEEKKLPDSHFLNVFPGEHYKILAGLIQELSASRLIDIGTFTGMSSRVMLDFSDVESNVQTFDIVPWDKFNSHLRADDFEESRCTQHLVDLSTEKGFKEHAHNFEDADIIFCDAPKDGRFEYEFLRKLSQSNLSIRPRYLLLDDIKFLNMAPLWRCIASPKFDLTSFGHWSGTGIVDISEGLSMKTDFDV